MKKAFLIHPVRGHKPGEFEHYVKRLENEGWQVYDPAKHTPQDESSISICSHNRAGIEAADCVFIIWDGKSTGSLFDLGMVFALKKNLIVLKTPKPTDHKSFQNLMYEMEDNNE